MRTPTALTLCLLILTSNIALACDDWMAMVVSVEGRASVTGAGHPAPRPLQADTLICPGEQLEVAAASRVAIYLRNNSFVRLSEHSVLSFPERQVAGSFWLQLKQGLSHFMSRLTQRMQVDTRYVNAAVEGTEFVITANADSSRVQVVEGAVRLTRPDDNTQLLLQGGQAAEVTAAPGIQVLQVAATAGIDWALYFPADMVLGVMAESAPELQPALTHVRQQRMDLAVQSLEQLPPSSGVRPLALATGYLALGNLPRARQLLQGQDSATALALSSLLAALTGQPEQALTLARQARRQSPNRQDLLADLALSYAWQVNMDLAAAYKAAERASNRHPQQAAAWLRRSELAVAMGDIEAAADALQRARSLQPEHPAVRVQSGFVRLFQLQLQAARADFEQVLVQVPGNPQAHLGLGLTLLRQGDTQAGRYQLELAVSLDPVRSVLRSYLGRAYFEEIRDDEAVVQWQLARELDPEDPTPYFYLGVGKLYQSDPVAAVAELETARELNQERALYRSETLLQSDAASRGAALAHAYNEAGHRDGARLAGWSALRQDVSGSQGHRLLADHYRSDSRYETARASELLQSQIWQPLSAYPLQPQLGETALATVEDAGPQQPGFNEYHPLFTQDGVYGAISGYGAADGAWGNDLVGSVLAGPLALSLGQFHYEANGWRDNAKQEQDLYNGLLQYQVSPQLQLQYEHRELNWDTGYITPELGVPLGRDEAEQIERDSDRVAVVMRPAADLAWALSVQSNDYELRRRSNLGSSDTTQDGVDETAKVYEWQWLKRSDAYQLLFGLEYDDVEYRQGVVQSLFQELGPGTFVQLDVNILQQTEARYQNAYLYFNYQLQPQLQLNTGLAYVKDDYEGLIDTAQVETFGTPLFTTVTPSGRVRAVDDEPDEWLPKLGLVYQVTEDHQVALAAMRSIARPDSVPRTLEPTLFSGFNQLFNDPERTLAKSLALRWDGRMDDLAMGAAVMRHKLEIPVLDTDNGQRLSSDYDEDSLDLYLYRPLGQEAALSVAGQWLETEWDEGDAINLGVDRFNRYSLPITLGLFNRSRTSVQLQHTYYKQKIIEAGAGERLEDSEWITDVQLKYRLPSVRGSLVCGINNLQDHRQEFVGGSPQVLAFYPGRQWFVNINLNL
ncbi:MAG: TonB-dependent receptor [Pseudomonadota bacterium]|nr:TonB-dependent receptor [Pseudomonadota bacterium]